MAHISLFIQLGMLPSLIVKMRRSLAQIARGSLASMRVPVDLERSDRAVIVIWLAWALLVILAVLAAAYGLEQLLGLGCLGDCATGRR